MKLQVNYTRDNFINRKKYNIPIFNYYNHLNILDKFIKKYYKVHFSKKRQNKKYCIKYISFNHLYNPNSNSKIYLRNITISFLNIFNINRISPINNDSNRNKK